MTDPQPDPDPRLEVIRLEQEVRSLRYRLEVKDEALRALNARLIDSELEVARRVSHAQHEMSLVLGPVWAIVVRLSRARQVLLPDDTRRGRWFKGVYGRFAARGR